MPCAMQRRSLPVWFLFGVLFGCAQIDAGDAPPATATMSMGTGMGTGTGMEPDANLDDPTDDTERGTYAVLRVHYPSASLPASGSRTLSVRGALSPFSWTSGVAMTKKSETLFELRVRGLTVPLEWKPLVDDTTWSIGKNYVAMPGKVVDVYPHFFTSQGRYERRYKAFHSAALGNDRGVWVYLPPSFDENPLARYPVLYMHDGQNLFDPDYAFGRRTWRVAETLEAGINALDPAVWLPEVVVIGPENTGRRIYEYTPTPDDAEYPGGGGGDLYLRFLRDELKPAIEKDPLLAGRLYTDRAHTVLAGSSLGGLITAYAGVKQPDVWSRLGIFSPSTFWDSGYILGAVAGAASLSPRWARVYVDSGQPGDGYEGTAMLADRYRAIGYRDDNDLKYVVAPGALHNEDAWAARLPAALRFLCAGF